MKQINQTLEKKFASIEPKGVFDKINPYRGSLKYIIENFGKKQKPKRVFLESTALMVAPAGLLYIVKEMKNIQKEICLEQGREVVEKEFDKDIKRLLYTMEFVKIYGAYISSSLVAKIIW